jgi:hypothetical protein
MTECICAVNSLFVQSTFIFDHALGRLSVERQTLMITVAASTADRPVISIWECLDTSLLIDVQLGASPPLGNPWQDQSIITECTSNIGRKYIWMRALSCR